MTDLQERTALITALKKATTRELSAAELQQQRISFVMGSLKTESGVTRLQVEEVLAKQNGLKHG